jgi:hypothetical protein
MNRSRLAVAGALLAILLGSGVVFHRFGPGKSTAPQTAVSRDAAQATVQALPELQAWSAYIERRSGGRSHGGLMANDTAPRMVDGRPCWAVDFVENGPDAVHRWETFLVDARDRSIRIDDVVEGRVLTLEQWRAQRPLDRVRQ